jgi:hypothetical protein
MFLLNGSSINIYASYTTADGVTYPHLRDATIRAELGITEVPDPVRADDRFYWNGDVNNPKMLEDRLEVKEDGSPLWEQTYDPATESMVDTDVQMVTRGLKYSWIQQVKQTANSLLAQTDWYVVVNRQYRRKHATSTVRAGSLILAPAEGGLETSRRA